MDLLITLFSDETGIKKFANPVNLLHYIVNVMTRLKINKFCQNKSRFLGEIFPFLKESFFSQMKIENKLQTTTDFSQSIDNWGSFLALCRDLMAFHVSFNTELADEIEKTNMIFQSIEKSISKQHKDLRITLVVVDDALSKKIDKTFHMTSENWKD